MKTIVVESAHQGTAFHRLATIEEIGKTGRAFYLAKSEELGTGHIFSAKGIWKEKLIDERHSLYIPL